ncbi:hypothetical protein ABVT39_010127 [Epinephelus coioides]
MAFTRELLSPLNLRTIRHHHRPDGERAACWLRRPRDRHAGTRAAAPRPRQHERDGARAAMNGSRTRRHPRGNGGGNRRARSKGSGLLPSQRAGVNVFLWVCQRTGSR